MKFYCDGSRVGMNDPCGPAIGWAAVCDQGVLAQGARIGGSNINAEMLAVRDLLRVVTLCRKRFVQRLQEAGEAVVVVTDSLTTLQILNGMRKEPGSFDLNTSENYRIAAEVLEAERKLKGLGIPVQYEHIRGHQESMGNNFADFVANGAAVSLLREARLNTPAIHAV